MPPKKLNFRMRISTEFKDDWQLFNDRAKLEGQTPADLLKSLVKDFLDAYHEEASKAESELDEIAPLRDSAPRKVSVKKRAPPKRKSFVSKKTMVSIKREKEPSADVLDISDTPKFRLLQLVKSLDDGDGIEPESLLKMAAGENIPQPNLQMNKMIRRGILYIHLGKVHIT